MKITNNFSLSEFEYSDTAKKMGIDNSPTGIAISNITVLCVRLLQPLRDKIGKPMEVSSGYRCADLNKAVGGSTTSQHTKGQAADIKVQGMTPKMLKDFILKTGLEFDQLITYKNKKIVHISYAGYHNRKQVLYL